jgi:hypothetical protein
LILAILSAALASGIMFLKGAITNAVDAAADHVQNAS